MVPNIGKRGRSFKGVTAYLLHDKEADTSERVEFTETRNLPFGDVESASRFMAWTDLNSETLKNIHAQAEGLERPRAGRPNEGANVLHSSLSWGIDQQPTREDMTQTADDWVKMQGWDEHQYYLVAHNDTDHAHIHIVVNLIHPATGMTADQTKSKERSDRWAQEYEEASGEIVCKNRDAKYQAWENDQPAFSASERKEEAGRIIEQAYHASDSASAFKAALEAQGFEFAQGRRKGLVLVDEDGEIYNPARHIDGVTGRELNKFLKGIDKASLQDADELQEQRQKRAEDLRGEKLAADPIEDPAGDFQRAAYQPHDIGSVVRPWRSGAQGVVTGFENERYQVTFTNTRTGKQIEAEFAPDEIKLIRDPEQERSYQQERATERAAWTNWNLVRERQVRDRIAERREYWQLDKLEKERDQAQDALDERSGWINRYVLRWRYQDAQDERDAKQMSFDHAKERWQTDIDAIQGKRTGELRRELEKQGFFVGGKRSDEGLERAHAESKDEQQEKDAKTLKEAQSSPQAAARLASVVSPRSSEQRAAAAEVKDAAKDFEKAQDTQHEDEAEQEKQQRDMTPAELEQFAQDVLFDVEDRLERQRAAKRKDRGFGLSDNGADLETDSTVRGRERDGAGGVAHGSDKELGADQDLRSKAEEQEKQQRDMSAEELEEHKQRLMDEMQDKLDEQYADHDRDEFDHADQAREAEDSIIEAEDQLQRDMSEAELEAYRDRLREIIIETQSMEADEGLDPERRQRDI